MHVAVLCISDLFHDIDIIVIGSTYMLMACSDCATNQRDSCYVQNYYCFFRVIFSLDIVVNLCFPCWYVEISAHTV